MSELSLSQVMLLADQLNREEQSMLLEHLQIQLELSSSPHLSREAIIAETIRLKQVGAFEKSVDLSNRWARPGLDLSLEELDKGISEFSNEWQDELNEYGNR
jgi:hypothetical protein